MTSALEAHEVARYLQGHPEFFVQYAELLSQIQIPNPHDGRAVSITERQMGSLRDKVRRLETKLAELIRFGEENDAIAEKVHRLGVELMGTDSLAGVMHALYSHLGGFFAVPHVAARLWGVGSGASLELLEVTDTTKAFAAALPHPYCGTGEGQETLAWFGDRGGQIRSMAQIPLREGVEGACFGLLVLASDDPHRFYADMGTLYLQRIGDMAAAALLRAVD